MIHSGQHVRDSSGDCVICDDQQAGLHIIVLREQVAKLQPSWTSVPPTKPGLCWARHRTEGVIIVRVVSPTEIESYNGEYSSPPGEFDLWCGPIEAPPIPEGT